MTIVGEAYVRIRPDDDGFEKETESKVGGTIKKLAAAAGAAFAAREVFNFGAAAFKTAEESNKIAAQTEAVIKSTGGAAKVSAQQISDLATAISNKTGVDDEAIQSGSNLLLTFTNIKNEAGKGNDVFNRATSTLTDMAAALGTDVSGSAVQLGKALNDPIAGISALSRVGVTFTDQQKEMIKGFVDSGNMAKAQGVILDELGKEFGGSAEAQATASDKLKVRLGNLQEEIGQRLIPVVDKIAGFLSDKAIPAFEAVMGIVGKVANAFKWLAEGDVQGFAEVMDNVMGNSGDWIDTFTTIGDVILSIVGFVRDNLVPVLAVLAAVILGVVGGPFALIAAGLAALYVKFDGFRAVVNAVVGFLVGTVIPAFVQFAGYIVEQLGNVVAWVKTVWPQISEAIGHVMAVIMAVVRPILEALSFAWQTFGDNIMRIVGIAFGFIKDTVENFLQVIRGIIQTVLALINGDWGKAWDGIKNIVSGIWGQITNVIRSSVGLAKEAVIWVGEQLLAAILYLPGKFLGIGGDTIKGLAQGIKDKAGDVINAIKEWVLDKLPGFVKKFLGIDSPSKMFAEFGRNTMEGFKVGIADGAKGLEGTLADALTVPDVKLNADVSAFGAAGAVAAVAPTFRIEQSFGAGTNAEDVRAAMVDVAQNEVAVALGAVVERTLAGRAG